MVQLTLKNNFFRSWEYYYEKMVFVSQLLLPFCALIHRFIINLNIVFSEKDYDACLWCGGGWHFALVVRWLYEHLVT